MNTNDEVIDILQSEYCSYCKECKHCDKKETCGEYTEYR